MTSETTSVNCSYFRLKVWCPSLKLKLIMSIVLDASLLPKGDDIITVTIKELNGEDVCSFDLKNGTLADLEKTLCDLPEPRVRCLPRSSLRFYTKEEPLMALDLQLPVCSFGSLVIEYKAPDLGKFLKAMQNNKFDPSSANFEMTWTAAEAPAVSAYETKGMIDQVLSGLPTHADSREHFVRFLANSLLWASRGACCCCQCRTNM